MTSFWAASFHRALRPVYLPSAHGRCTSGGVLHAEDRGCLSCTGHSHVSSKQVPAQPASQQVYLALISVLCLQRSWYRGGRWPAIA